MIFVAALFPAHSSTRVSANVPVRAARTARGTVAVPGRKRSSTGSFGLTARNRTRRSPISSLDLCVANRENGEPGSYSYSTINWHAVNEYRGAYSFLHETWVAAGGLRYAFDANEASPGEQSVVFNHWSRVDPGAWPNTLPACE